MKPDKGNNNGNNNKRNIMGLVSIIFWALLFTMMIKSCTSSYANMGTVEVPYTTFKEWLAEDKIDTVNVENGKYTFTLRDGVEVELPREETSGGSGSLMNSLIPVPAQTEEGKAVYHRPPGRGGRPGAAGHAGGARRSRLHRAGGRVGLFPQPDPLLCASPAADGGTDDVPVPGHRWKGRHGRPRRRGQGQRQGLCGEEAPASPSGMWPARTRPRNPSQEIIDILHNPQKYTEIGAKLPKGALLVGPPGTGKTLLAKAVAGEAGVPFFSISGSDFVEMFVGVGASRVRDLFKEASKMAPCIIFIDEIDTIGKSRDNRMGGNDEREQTLNQLLAELDGFDPGKGVIVLGATNRPEVLDKALLRPGRFDRRITIDRPNLAGRLATLQVHTRKIKLGEDVDLKKIALATAG